MRRRYFLGATADDVKDYFDVSAYRNILDMLNAFDSSLTAVANYFHNRLVPMGRITDKMLKGMKTTDIGRVGGHFEVAGPAFGYKPNFGKNLKVFWPIVNSALEAGGTQPINGKILNPQLDPYVLLDLARSVEWEMNRVRLPVPHNFRQLNTTLSGRDYEFKVTHAEVNPFAGGVDIGITDEGGLIPAIELLKTLPQVRAAVAEMRNSVRKEIDAAELAAQVEEETLRREEEDLISREQAEQEAAARESAIAAEKEAQYREDLAYIIDQLAIADTVERRNKLAAGANKVLTALASLVGDVSAEQALIDQALARVDSVLVTPLEPGASQSGASVTTPAVGNLLAQYQQLLDDMQAASQSERQAYAAQLQRLEQQLNAEGVEVEETPQGGNSVIVPLSLLGLLLFSGG